MVKNWSWSIQMKFLKLWFFISDKFLEIGSFYKVLIFVFSFWSLPLIIVYFLVIDRFVEAVYWAIILNNALEGNNDNNNDNYNNKMASVLSIEIVELSLTLSVDLLVELSVGRYPEFFSCFYTSKWIVTFTITLLSIITDFSFSFLSFFSHIKYVSEIKKLWSFGKLSFSLIFFWSNS